LSSKIQVGLTSGILGLLLFGIIIGAYFIQETKNTAEDAKVTAAKNVKIAQEFDKRVSTFIDNWNKRVQVGNKINNATQTKLLNLSIEGTEQEHQLLALQHNATEILHKQIINEKNIQDNLTRHRIVANSTRDMTIDILNDTERLIQQLNATQQKAVANLTAQHDDILNIIKNNTK
jgi:hypothetical protein